MSKRGLLIQEFSVNSLFEQNGTLTATIEFEAVETTANKTKIKILNVGGVDKMDKRRIKEMMDGDWVLTNQIEWLK